MAFTESWVETDPDGSVITVSQLDNFERATKRQVRERLEGDPANLNLSGVFETFGTGAVVKKGVARTFTDTIANIGSYPLQDGRLFIATDTGRVYHLKGSGAIEFQYLPLTGGALTGGIIISVGAIDTGLNIQANAGQNRYVRFRTGSLDRWVITTTASAESGGQAGSDFTINRYDDTGALIGTVLTLTRSSGLATFNNSLLVGAGVLGTQVININDGTNAARFYMQVSGGGGLQVKPDASATLKQFFFLSSSSVAQVIVDMTNGAITCGAIASTGSILSSNGASNSLIEIRSNNATKRSLFWTTAGSVRWEAYTDSTNEGGSDIGSDWNLARYNDAGTFVDNSVIIQRSTGRTLLTATIATAIRLSNVANSSAPVAFEVYGSPTATPTVYSRAGGLYLDFAAGVPSKFGLFSDSVDIEVKSLNSANTINLLNKVSLSTTGIVAATSILDINKDHAAAALANYIKFNRQGGAKAFLGLDLSDNFVVADSSGANINFTIQNAGQVVVRRGSFVIDQGVAYPQMQWFDGSNTLECGWSANTFFFKQTQVTQRSINFRTAGSTDILTIDFNADIVSAHNIMNAGTGYRINGNAGLGKYLRGDGTNFVSATPLLTDFASYSVRTYKSSAGQSLSQNTLTAITFDAEDFDTNSLHDNVTNNSRLTAPVAGKYKITAHICWQGVSSNVFIVIRKNGVATDLAKTSLTVTGTSVGTTEVNVTLSLAANDYVEVYGQSDAVSPTILNNLERTYFEMALIAA